MSTLPEVSTIIPVYNGASYVARAVRSALGQLDVETEVIVVDDGSTDATPEILSGFGEAIRLVRQTNAGHIAARNRAAQLATGKWLAFLDADDEWLPNKLQKQLSAAADAGMVYTERLNVGDADHVAARQSEGGELPAGAVFQQLLLGNFVTVSSVIMRRDWFERLGGFDPKPFGCEDWDLWLRYSAEGGIIRVVPEPLTRYYWRQDAMSKKHTEMQSGRLIAIRHALTSPQGRQVAWSVAAKARASTWKTAAWYAGCCRSAKAIPWYLRSIAHWPWDPSVYRQIVKCCLEIPFPELADRLKAARLREGRP